MWNTNWCSDSHRAIYPLDENGIDYINIDVEMDEAALLFVMELNGGRWVVPTIVFPDGTVLVEPSNSALAAKLNVTDGWNYEWWQEEN